MPPSSPPRWQASQAARSVTTRTNRPSSAPRRATRRERRSSALPPPPPRTRSGSAGGRRGRCGRGGAVPSSRAPTRPPGPPPSCSWTRTTGRRASRPPRSRARPIGAPLLISDGDELSSVTSDTLKSLNPKGSDLSKDAQVIRIGSAPARPEGYRTAVIEGKDPYSRAAAIDRFFSAAKGRPSANVVVASGEQARATRCPRPHGRRARATPCCSPSATPYPPPPGRRSPSTISPTSSFSARRR